MGKLMQALKLKVSAEDANEELEDDQLEGTDTEVENNDDVTEGEDAGDDTDADTEADEDAGDEGESDDDAADEEDAGTDTEGDDDTAGDDDGDHEFRGDDSGTTDDAGDKTEPTEGEVYESAGSDGAKLDEISKQLLDLNTDAEEAEVADVQADQDIIEEVSDSLESIRSDLIASMEDGGLTSLAARFAQEAVQLHLDKVGATIPVISKESFGLSNTRVGSTQVIVAGIEGKLADLAGKAKAGVMKVIEAIKGFFAKLFNTYKGIAAKAEELKAQLPDTLDGKVKLSGSDATAFASAGKLVTNVSAALRETYALIDDVNKDQKVGTWYLDFVSSPETIAKNGDFGTLRIKDMPAYLTDTSTDSRYSSFLDDGYAVKIRVAPIGNYDIYGTVVSENDVETVNAENALRYAKQRFGAMKYAELEGEHDVNLGSKEDIIKGLDAVIAFHKDGEESKQWMANFLQANHDYKPVEDKDKESAIMTYIKCLMQMSKNYLQPNNQAIMATNKATKAYMSSVAAAIKAAKASSASAASDDAATA